MTTTVMVPDLATLRAMSENDLLRLRTDIASDLSKIQHQIRFEDNDDPDWIRRVGAAAHIREQGIATIKNVIAERTSHRPVLLHSWLDVMQRVVDAAIVVADVFDDPADPDPDWMRLDKAIQAYQKFTVDMSLVD